MRNLLSEELVSRIEAVLNSEITAVQVLLGGSVGDVWRIETVDHHTCVVKRSRDFSLLERERKMLLYLKEKAYFKTAEFIALDQDLIFLDYIENDGISSVIGEQQAADILLDLHQIRADKFGFPYDTTIGPLPQNNQEKESWIAFFRDSRLLFMSELAYQKGNLTLKVKQDIEDLSCILERYLVEPDFPSLLHGDVWGGNILYRSGDLAGIIDPALSYGHWEMDIAYAHFFDSFSDAFYQRYNKVNQLDKEFYSIRILIYYLYPLLVHCAIFGGDYITQTDQLLARIKKA